MGSENILKAFDFDVTECDLLLGDCSIEFEVLCSYLSITVLLRCMDKQPG